MSRDIVFVHMDSVTPAVIPEKAEKDFDVPEEIAPASLKSSKSYHCANHPAKEAFCVCVKCGNCLCKDCGWLVNGRRYCDQCISQDEQLLMAYQKELLRPRIVQTAMEIQQCRPLRRISDIPLALRNMVRENTIFFVTAKDASFALTYYLAVFALLPNILVQVLVRQEDFIKNLEQALSQSGFAAADVQSTIEQVSALPTSTFVLGAILSALVNVLLIDLVYWLCLRVFTPSKMKFTQAGALMHFCLLPLIFTVIGAYFDFPFISFVALALMIIQATTATRVSTQCSLFQGLCVMITFIVIITKASII